MSISRESALRVALFVEGARASSGSEDPLELLWRWDLCSMLGLRGFDRVVGINKANLVAMDSQNLGLATLTSSMQDPLDELMKRELELDRKPFDAAVVCWDLQPPWDRKARVCRWDETRQFYRGLAASKRLPVGWSSAAKARSLELEGRATPAARAGAPKLAPFATLAVCMEPMFEGMLLHEAGVRLALGLRNSRVPGWPSGWTQVGQRSPDDLLARAIATARRLSPRPAVFKKVRVEFNQAKHEWASLILRAGGPTMRNRVVRHPTSQRLQELLAAPGVPAQRRRGRQRLPSKT